VFLHRLASPRRITTIEKIFAQYGTLAIVIPALCPPPTPFKSFVATAGALQFPVKRFLILVTLARSVRYLGMSLLAVLYGKRVEAFIKEHSVLVALIIIVVVSIAFFLYRFLESRIEAKSAEATPATKDGRQCA
jgi:membrane protein DedA with SNARE-associated domain